MTERIWGDLVLEKHDGGMVTDHPLVLWDGWCGEWKEMEWAKN